MVKSLRMDDYLIDFESNDFDGKILRSDLAYLARDFNYFKI